MTTTSNTSSKTPPAPVGGLLQEQAYIKVKARLMSGDVPGGTVLSERQIASELGMSKTPVKAAFTRLDQEGFLRISPQHGVVVRTRSSKEMIQQMDLRIALESHLVKQLANKGLTDAEWNKIEKHLQEQAMSTASAEISEITRTDGAFHLMLAHFADNAEMTKIVAQVLDKQYQAIANVLSQNSYRQSDSLEEHRAIAAAIREGRGHLASELMVAHLERGKELFTEPRQGPRDSTH